MNEDGIYNLGFGDIYGAGTGQSQGISNLVQTFFDTLSTGGYFSTDDEKYQGSLAPAFTYGGGQDVQGVYGAEDPLQELINRFSGATTSDNIIFSNMTDDEKKGYEYLGKLLDRFRADNVVGGYRQDVGDVGAEIGSQMDVLGKSLTSKGKGSRYSQLTSGGRGKGSRKKYESDYYGLIDKEQEMVGGLQSDVTEDVNRMVMDYMGMFPS